MYPLIYQVLEIFGASVFSVFVWGLEANSNNLTFTDTLGS